MMMFSMLTIQQISHLRRRCQQLELLLPEYEQHSSRLNLLEARYTLYHLGKLLEHRHPSMRATLLSFLLERWNRIKNTDVQYCHDAINPGNMLCIEMAKALAGREGSSYLALLMPTLTKVPVSSYISSSWTDDIDLKEIIISDNNERIICIPDVLGSAVMDGVLKHNSMFMGKAKMLDFGEKDRLLARHPTVENHYQAIQDKVNFALHGETAGAYLARLIRGLRDGGVQRGGEEFDSGVDANVAIVDFDSFLQRLPHGKRRMVLNMGKVDRVTSGRVERISIGQYWENLGRRNDSTLTDASDMSINLCVELIAGYLQEILDENQELYQLSPFDDPNLTSLSELDNKVRTTHTDMLDALHASTQHGCYGTETDNQLATNLCRKIAKSPHFILNVDDIVCIAMLYSKNKLTECEGNQDILASCTKVLLGIHSRYKRAIVMQALAAMPSDVATQYRNLCPQVESSVISTHTFFDDSGHEANKRVRLRYSTPVAHGAMKV